MSSTPEALASRLPDHLREFRSFSDPDDYRMHASAVADYLNTQVPGLGSDLAGPVMKAVGLTAAGWYAGALGAERV